MKAAVAQKKNQAMLSNKPLYTYATITTLCFFVTTNTASSQSIVPDSTLPTNSTVTQNDNAATIAGGTISGTNLFHSFKEFSVVKGQSAYFNNSPKIENIITRVTGSYISNIDGTIRTNGNTNLFLLNPNGIVFGANAALDIGGSFFASTADAWKFPDGSFSATNTNSSAILSISVPIGIQWGGKTTGEIRNEANLSVNQNLSFAAGTIISTGNLTVPKGNLTVTALGDVSLTNYKGASLNILTEGAIRVGSIDTSRTVASSGDVLLDARGDIVVGNFITTNSDVGKSGNIQLVSHKGNIDTSRAFLSAGDLFKEGGNIVAEAIGDISFGTIQTSGNINRGGDITLRSQGKIFATEGIISTLTTGKGNAGSIKIESQSIALDNSFITSSAKINSSGNAGDISIKTNSLSLFNGAFVLSETAKGTQGNSGNISIQAQNILLNSGDNERYSFIKSVTGSDTPGSGGNISVFTDSLQLNNRASIKGNTQGVGNSGEVAIQAKRDVTLTNGSSISNEASDGKNQLKIEANSLLVDNSSLLTQTSGSANAGEIKLKVAESISIANTSIISSGSNGGNGNGGDISLEADSLTINNSSSINASNLTPKKAGAINLNIAGDIALNNLSRIGNVVMPSRFTNLNDISIQARSLGVFGGSSISTDVLATTIPSKSLLYNLVNAGNIAINSTQGVIVDGFWVNQLNQEIIPSKISSQNFAYTVVNGGNINITSSSFAATNGANISASTIGNGNAGDINFLVSDWILVDGVDAKGNPTTVNSQVGNTATGNGGNINFTTRNLTIANQANISARSDGRGNAGNIQFQTNNLTLNQGIVSADTASGEGGNINLSASNFLQLQNRSLISATARGAGNSGNINIQAKYIIANPKTNNDITANTVQGRGGNIKISSDTIVGIEKRLALTKNSDVTATSESGVDGNVNIDSLKIDPNRDVLKLPTEIIDYSNQINQTCSNRVTRNRFTIIGRGGLPLGGKEVLNGNIGWIDWRIAKHGDSKQDEAMVKDKEDKLVEAVGWQVDSSGGVKLVAEAASQEFKSNYYAVQCHIHEGKYIKYLTSKFPLIISNI